MVARDVRAAASPDGNGRSNHATFAHPVQGTKPDWGPVQGGLYPFTTDFLPVVELNSPGSRTAIGVRLSGEIRHRSAERMIGRLSERTGQFRQGGTGDAVVRAIAAHRSLSGIGVAWDSRTSVHILRGHDRELSLREGTGF